MAISKEQMDEIDQHMRYTSEYITTQLTGQDLTLAVQTQAVIRMFVGNAIPPDSITAKALRIVADALDYASDRLGKDPTMCSEYRELEARLTSGKPPDSAWDK